jgi:hypothetical protein
MMRNNRNIIGALLVVVGILFLLDNIFDFNIFSSFEFWPLIILGIGLVFEFSFFSRGRAAGLLVPGGILTTIGILFLFETATNWHFSEYTWPVYELAVAVGLFQLYLFGGRKRGLLIPVGILTGLAVLSFAAMLYSSLFAMVDWSIVIAAFIILIGVSIIISNRKK